MLNNNKKEKIYYGSITIFYKKIDNEILFLVVENAETGNISFVSGAKEKKDKDFEETAKRENLEELSLSPNQYNLKKTNIKHKFIFNSKKKERVGAKGEYNVFISDLSNTNIILTHTKELKNIKWMNIEQIYKSFIFPDLIDILNKSLEVIDK